jgi:hypothetical protein
MNATYPVTDLDLGVILAVTLPEAAYSLHAAVRVSAFHDAKPGQAQAEKLESRRRLSIFDWMAG